MSFLKGPLPHNIRQKMPVLQRLEQGLLERSLL